MRELKLTIDLLPKGAWGNNLSKTLSKEDWNTLRHECYKRANNCCAICGFGGDLDAHEIWNFDIKTQTQTLLDIVALCSRCHGVKHFRNSERLGHGENAKRHFLKVNGCNELDFAAHVAEAESLFEELNEIFRWKIKADLNKFGGKGIDIRERNIPRIINPFERTDWEKCQNYCNLLPKVKSVEVNNYDGTISVICDKTNKIEWICKNKIIKTKYNFAGRFTTKFCVEGLECPKIQFSLVGKGGRITAQPFTLTNWV